MGFPSLWDTSLSLSDDALEVSVFGCVPSLWWMDAELDFLLLLSLP
jgi:hypothetical protein